MSDSEENSDLASIFGGDASLAEQIPEHVRPVLLERWLNLRKTLDSSRPSANVETSASSTEVPVQDPIARTRELEAKTEELERQLTGKNEENENLARQLEDMHSSYSQARQKSVALEESNDKLTTENQELKRNQDHVSRELEEYRQVSDRRREDIESLHKDVKRLTEQLAESNASKCEALIKYENIQAQEIALKHKEERIDHDRDLFEERLNSLSEDLRSAHETASLTRREFSAKIAQLEGDLSHKNETIRILEGRQEALNSDKEVLQSRIDDLITRLKEARDSKSDLEEGFRQEVRAQTRLADLYQKQASDSDDKAEKLTQAVSDLQNLLKEAGERYGALEDNLEKEKIEHKDEIKRRNEAIRVLRKELTDANDLIKELKHKGMTDEGIAALSPAAAAASKLIKSGMSLTQVYSQLVTCQEELLAAEDEKRRLSTYIEQILTDIEQRAPALKRQRDEYERAVTTVNQLSSQIEEMRESSRLDTENSDLFKRKLDNAEREIERMSKQNKDLGQQVTVLLREVEAARFGRTTRNLDDSQNSEVLDADGAISERLVSFRDVQELQKKNAELLMVIREVTSKQEASEAKLVEERTADLKKELDTVTEKLEDLTEARRRQEALVENIVMQRDMYKTMAESAKEKDSPMMVTSTPASGKKASPQIHSQAEVRAAKAEAALEEVKKDFQTYREEKTTHERMLEESLEKAKTELTESRNKTIKLVANEEWNTERFKIAQTNNANYKKEISFLEEKNNSLNALVGKHEQSIQVMHAELVQANTQVSRLTSQWERAKHEVEILKNAHARLEKERDILTRQTSGSAMIAENLKLVQLRLDQADSEARMRLTNQNEDLTKEVNLLRKKIEHEQESYHKSVKAWESAQLELRSKVDSLKESEAKAQENVEKLNTELEEVKHQLQISQEKLSIVANAGSSSTVVDSEKCVDLQSQVNALKNENITLKEHLTRSRNATNQYKELADSCENSVKDSNKVYKEMKEKYEELQKTSQETQKEMESKIAQLESAQTELEKQANEGLEAVQGGVANAAQLRQNIELYKEQIQGFTERQHQMEIELRQQQNECKEIQERYERELIAHAATANSLKELRDAIRENDAKINQLEEANRNYQATLKDLKTDSKTTEETLRSQYKSLQDQFEVVEKENSALHQQMANLSTQMASIQETKSQDQSLNLSKSFSEEEAKSMEQLMEIIKYLRSEKSILTGKVEVSRAESIRLKAQLESLTHQLNETQNALSSAQEKSHAELLPSSKYSQLLEKVQTIPALSDSNRYLREERDELKAKMEETEKRLEEAQKALEPMEEKLRSLQESEDKLNVDVKSLTGDRDQWKARCSQLIEKHQKINPEELLKAQNENSTLKEKVTRMLNEQKVSHTNMLNLNRKIKETEENLAKKTGELQKAMQELQSAKTLHVQKCAALQKKANESDAASKLLIGERDSLNTEVQKLKIEVTNSNAKNQELTTKVATSGQELEKTKSELTAKTAEADRFKIQVDKLKALGRTLKQGKDILEKETKEQKEKIEAMTQENTKLNESINSLKSEASVPRSESEGAPASESEALLEASLENIKELEKKVEKLEEEKKTLESSLEASKEEAVKASGKETKAMDVLKKAKEKMTNLTVELKKYKDNASPDVKSMQAELEKEKAEKESLKEALEKAKKDAETKAAETPQKAEAETVKVKPQVSSAQPRVKSVQPQAQVQPQPQQVQPTRHVPAVHPPTASIRPTRPTIQRPPPTASVSPSSAAPAALNPNAAEFVPTPTVTETPSLPIPINPQPGPSSMTAQVAPTMKRNRDDDNEGETAKKARTVETAQEGGDDVDVIELDSSDEEDEEQEPVGEPDNEEGYDEDDSEGEMEDNTNYPSQVEASEEADEEQEMDDPDLEDEPDYEVEQEVDADADIVEIADDDPYIGAEGMEDVTGQAEESGGAVVPQMSGDAASSRAEESAPEASSLQQGGQFDDAVDDSVVPSTPKESSAAFRFAASTQSETQSSSSGTFVDLAAQASTSAPSSGVKGASQEGIDRTQVNLFETVSSSPVASASSFSALAKMSPSTPLFGGIQSGPTTTSTSPFTTTTTITPVFGAPPALGKSSLATTSLVFGSRQSPTTTTTEAKTEDTTTTTTADTGEASSQPAEFADSRPRPPRISRTPITWGSSSSSTQPEQQTTQRGRGSVQKAKRSRGRGNRGGAN